MEEKQQSRQSANLRTLVIVAIILIALAAPIGLCTHLYISHKEAYLTERNLRLLGYQGDRLGQMIENLADQVLNNNAALVRERCEACLELPGPKGAPEKQNRSRAVTQYKEGLETLLKLASNLKLTPDSVSILRAKPEWRTQSVEIEPIERDGVSWLSFRYAGPLGEKGYAVSFLAEAQIADLVGTLGDGIFDDIFLILVKAEKNQVIFQEAASGPKLASIDTVKNEKGDEVPFAKITPSSGVFSLSLAGREYRLFLEPVRLSSSLRFGQGSSKDEVPGEMFLCGLVDAHRFRTESLAISYTWLLLALFVFLIVTASWPLIKLLSLRSAERLRLGDVVLVSISVLAVSGLLTFFQLDAYGYAQLRSLQDQQMESLASEVGGRLRLEVKGLYGLLDRFHETCKPPGTDKEDKKSEVSILQRGPRPEWLPRSGPYFESIVLVGMDGLQIRKWTVEDVTTRFIRVPERGYFKAIKEDRGWKSKELGSSPFFIEPIFSKNTGKTLSVLSRQGPGWEESSPTCVASLTAKLISLKGAVMPPGFGYAIVDDSGVVLFHSDARRSLVENFFVECDGNRQLRALAFARTKDWVDASYWGRPHRLFVSPLGGGIPWMLVVFRDKELAQTANLELLSASVILSLFYGLVFLLPALLYCFRRPKWIWPDESRAADYLLLLAVNVSLIALSLSEFFCVRHHHVPPLAFVLPPFALLLNCARLKAGTGRWQWSQLPFFLLLSALPALLLLLTWVDGGAESSIEVATLQALWLCVLIPLARPVPGVLVPSFLRSLRHSRWVPAASTLYLLLAGSLVITLSALPVVVFYRSAYDSEMEIFVKHAQLGLARGIAMRNDSVRQEYGKVPAAPELGYLEKRLKANDDIYDIPLVKDEQAGPRGLHAEKSVEGFKQDGRCVFDAHPFEKVLRAVRPLYNDTAVQTHELVYDRSADCSVQWKETRGGVISLQSEPTGMKNLPQGSKVPLLARPSTLGSWLGLMSALLVLFVLIGLLVRWVVRRLFWIDLLEAAPSAVTDLDRVGDSDDPARKEGAISEEALEAGIAAANLREECKRALREECSRTSWLRRIGMDILAQPDVSGLDARRLMADVLDRARAFYHSLWRGCSQEERLLLFDLAEDGFVNAKGEVRRRLIERGLVVRGSQLRLVNESFRAFIVEMGRAGNIHAAQEEARNPQRVMRMILGTGVVAVAFIVFLTQPQMWNLSTTFIGAVGAGIPSMMALLNMLHGRRAQR